MPFEQVFSDKKTLKVRKNRDLMANVSKTYTNRNAQHALPCLNMPTHTQTNTHRTLYKHTTYNVLKNYLIKAAAPLPGPPNNSVAVQKSAEGCAAILSQMRLFVSHYAYFEAVVSNFTYIFIILLSKRPKMQ